MICLFSRLGRQGTLNCFFPFFHPALDGSNFMSAKFHLVDLAGSERASRTGAVGERFKGREACNVFWSVIVNFFLFCFVLFLSSSFYLVIFWFCWSFFFMYPGFMRVPVCTVYICVHYFIQSQCTSTLVCCLLAMSSALLEIRRKSGWVRKNISSVNKLGNAKK